MALHIETKCQHRQQLDDVMDWRSNEQMEQENLHFLMRLPAEEARLVRKVMREDPRNLERKLFLQVDADQRTAEVTVTGKTLPMRLVDLPNIVEALTPIGSKPGMIKVADIAQMLIVDSAEGKKAKNMYYKAMHGISAPMKNSRRTRFRKTIPKTQSFDEVEDIEKAVNTLMREDSEAIRSTYEIVYEDNNVRPQDLFGQITSSEQGDTDID